MTFDPCLRRCCRQVCEEIKKYSTVPPFCVPYHPRIFDSISVPIHAAHLYDAVMIYARALTKVLQDGLDPRNGTAILQHIRATAYESVQGFDVRARPQGLAPCSENTTNKQNKKQKLLEMLCGMPTGRCY